MGHTDDAQIMGIPHRRLSKAEFVSLVDGQIERCMENEAALGALTIVYAFMEFMSGEGRVSDWIDTYMPLELHELIKIKSEDFWGSRCGLVHSMDVHNRMRDLRQQDYTPIMFHQGLDESTRIFFSSNFHDEDIVVEKGTNILPLNRFVEAFRAGIQKWADDAVECPPFVFPILGRVNSSTRSGDSS